MKRSKAKLPGVTGAGSPAPVQGAQCESVQADLPIEQSCQRCDLPRSVRIGLPDELAKQPAPVRTQIVSMLFASASAQIDLRDLVGLVKELRAAKDAIINALLFSLAQDTPLNTERVHKALDKIDLLLGGDK